MIQCPVLTLNSQQIICNITVISEIPFPSAFKAMMTCKQSHRPPCAAAYLILALLWFADVNVVNL